MTIESLFYDLVLSWIPFYAYIRFFTLLYLSTIGAQRAYDDYLAVYLDRYGARLEYYIERLRLEQVFGLLSGFMVWVREQMLGSKSHAAAAPSAPPGMAAAAAYAQSVFSRLPAFGNGTQQRRQQQQQRSPAAPAVDVVSMVSGFMTHSVGTSRSAPTDTGESTPTIPGHFAASTPAEKMEFITSQRSRLQAMLQQLDREAETLSKNQESEREMDIHRDVERRMQGENISRSRSAGDFEKVERDEVDSDGGNGSGKAAAAAAKGWGGWLWDSGGAAAKNKKE